MTKPILMTWLALVLTMCSMIASAEETLHRVDPRNSEGLRELFRYDSQPLPLVSAHRGGAVPGYPENCLATFEHTLRHTFSILEIDLQYSNDGEIVLHHDATLERTTTGSGRVADRTLAELKDLRLKDNAGMVTEYRMPTLDEALEWARGKTIVILDKKVVPVEVCVEKIAEHRAEAYAMVMAYSLGDIRDCYDLNPNIMMEVMIGDRTRFREFSSSGVPWDRIVAFVGHDPPEDAELLNMIHDQGAFCMAGTSRNLDRELLIARPEARADLAKQYRARLAFGVDLIETDLPVEVAGLVYAAPQIPESKAKFLLPAKPNR